MTGKNQRSLNILSVKLIQTRYHYKEWYWIIDGIPVVNYLEEHVMQEIKEKVEFRGSFLGLMNAWTGKLIDKVENIFVWKLVESMEEINVPILVCEDDCDLSCIVIVAHIRKSETYIYWNKIGIIDWRNYSFKKEKMSGVLWIEAYTEEDYDKYGATFLNISLEDEEYKDWYSSHYEEEMLKCKQNYMKPYIQKEENIHWLVETNWKFEKGNYDFMIEQYRRIFWENMKKFMEKGS